MSPCCRREFDRIYRRAVDRVGAHWTPQMQAARAGNCKPRAEFDVRNYLQRSARRCYLAYCRIAASGAETVCDIGGLWGVFSIALTDLGYRVTMTAALGEYGAVFARPLASVRAAGVTVLDCDMFGEGAGDVRFDYVTALDVLEHHPHSLRRFMENLRAIIAPGGRAYLEVPSIAYWPKRVGLLLGRSPLPPLEAIYQSAAPFTGHHHEFTMDELLELASLAELRVTHKNSFNYSHVHSWPRRLARRPIETLAVTLFPGAREVLAVECDRAA